METFLISVSYRCPPQLLHQAMVTADMGFECPVSPPTTDEMQHVAYAAKMALIKILRQRKTDARARTRGRLASTSRYGRGPGKRK